MSQQAELVQEFREIIATAVQSVEDAPRLDFGNLSFNVSGDVESPRHAHALYLAKSTFLGRSSTFAIRAIASKEESLTRTIAVPSPRLGWIAPIDSERELSDISDLQDAVAFARSPHLELKRLVALGERSEVEQADFEERYEKEAQASKVWADERKAHVRAASKRARQYRAGRR